MESEYSKLLNEYRKEFDWSDKEMAAIWRVLASAFKHQKEQIVASIKEI